MLSVLAGNVEMASVSAPTVAEAALIKAIRPTGIAVIRISLRANA